MSDPETVPALVRDHKGDWATVDADPALVERAPVTLVESGGKAVPKLQRQDPYGEVPDA